MSMLRKLMLHHRISTTHTHIYIYIIYIYTYMQKITMSRCYFSKTIYQSKLLVKTAVCPQRINFVKEHQSDWRRKVMFRDLRTKPNSCVWQKQITTFMMTSSNGNIFRVTGPLWWIPLTKASDAELWCSLRSAPEQTVEQAMEIPVIRDAIALIMTSLMAWFNWYQS